MDSEKLMNLFETDKMIDYLIIYSTIFEKPIC